MTKVEIDLTLDGDMLSRAKLFKQPGAGNFAPSCMISSHGWYTAASSPYTPPAGVNLWFYCQHSTTLDDLGNVREALNGMMNPLPAVAAPNGTTDYTLGKLQAHRSEIQTLATHHGMTFQEADENIGDLGQESYGYFRTRNEPLFDFVTVRNRQIGSNTVTLSRLIEAVRAVHPYTDFYCAFCREQK